MHSKYDGTTGSLGLRHPRGTGRQGGRLHTGRRSQAAASLNVREIKA